MTSFDENVMYFKTILMVIWSLMLLGFGIAMNFYNLKQHKLVSKNVMTFPTLAYAALWLPIGVDIFVDVSTAFEPKNLIPGGIMFLLIVMVIAAIFSVIYVVSFYHLTGDCVELSCYTGYTPIDQQFDLEQLQKEFGAVNNSAYVATEKDIDLEFGGTAPMKRTLDINNNVIDEEEEKAFKTNNFKRFATLMRVNRTDWFALVNYTLLNNIIWALASWNIVLMLVYIARIWCLYDDNINRGVDVSFASLFLIIVTVITAVYDWFMFWSYSHIAVAHYVSYAVYAASIMIEFNRIVGAEEAFTFIALALNVALIAVKVIAGMRFRAIHMALKGYNRVKKEA